MKLKTQSKPDKGDKNAATEITVENFDKHISYVGNKIATASIRKEAIGKSVKRLSKSGFLVVDGDKPGSLVHPVRHDPEGDVYGRIDGKKTVFGSVEAINSLKHKGFKAVIVDLKGLRAIAAKVNKGLTVKRRSDKEEVKVVLLRPFSDQYVPGIAVDGKNVRVLNMEHPARHNHKSVQYEPGADFAAKELLAKLG